MPRAEALRRLLLVLGRAAGLSGVALATLGAGACGPCYDTDECATLAKLRETRDNGVAASGSAGTSSTSSGAATAASWDGMSCPSPSQYSAIVELQFPGRYSSSFIASTDLDNGKCCYHVREDCGGDGRPFLVGGVPRVAPSKAEDESCPPTHELPWLTTAQLEHASIASFARLSLQLLAHGAPIELVRDAQLASLDELRHAEIFFELASAEYGSKLSSGALDVRGALDDLSLASLVTSNLLEGCVGETLAAEQLRRRAEQVGDAKLRAVLLEVADDETRHAALAFRILAWCRELAPELTRGALRGLLAEESASRDGHEAWTEVLAPLLGALC